jgi:hypothetical protein
MRSCREGYQGEGRVEESWDCTCMTMIASWEALGMICARGVGTN